MLAEKTAPQGRRAGGEIVNIVEAVKIAMETRMCIRRRCWDYPTSKPMIAVKILPTNSPDGCVLLGVAHQIPRNGWQPNAEDLVAEDWETVRL